MKDSRSDFLNRSIPQRNMDELKRERANLSHLVKEKKIRDPAVRRLLIGVFFIIAAILVVCTGVLLIFGQKTIVQWGNLVAGGVLCLVGFVHWVSIIKTSNKLTRRGSRGGISVSDAIFDDISFLFYFRLRGKDPATVYRLLDKHEAIAQGLIIAGALGLLFALGLSFL
ncbi:MAG: hypothetical protein ACFFC7_08300 [Candidatus Hermodarchaeota archaeon]